MVDEMIKRDTSLLTSHGGTQPAQPSEKLSAMTERRAHAHIRPHDTIAGEWCIDTYAGNGTWEMTLRPGGKAEAKRELNLLRTRLDRHERRKRVRSMTVGTRHQ